MNALGLARIARLAVAGLSAAMFGACLELAGGSSSTETGDKVALTGAVRGGNAEGIPGVVVMLTNSALVDTTDLRGTYRFSLPRDAAPSLARPDTLRFILQGNVVATTEVRRVEDPALSLTLVQRGFSGTFTGADNGIGRIEAVAKGGGLATGDSITATFFHNSLAGNYSGFIWFPLPHADIRHYTVHVNIYDGGGRLTGRSLTVPFNDLAGNIVIPAFNPENLLPNPTPTSKRASRPQVPDHSSGGFHASP